MMARNYGRFSPQEFDPITLDTQLFQDAEPTEIPAAIDDAPLSARQQQPSRASSTPVEASISNNPFLRNFSSPASRRSIASPPPISPWPSMSANRQVASLERQKSLGDYFAIEETPRTTYTDHEFADIARLLKETDREPWSRMPRIYTVLRLIGQVSAIHGFLDLGMNDLWLPFHVSQLPNSLSAFHREKFMESQNTVLTKAIDLESDSLRKHAHFKQGESFPLEVQEQLGKGGYGAVDKVYSFLSGRTYARKRFRRTKAKSSEVQSFMTELQVLKRINHQHCVELVASYTDSKYFGLLISPVADYNLSSFYNIVTNNNENQNILRTFFGCLAHALYFLHQNKIRHRDIKPENILVKGSGVYLADFGISLDWEHLSRSTTDEDHGKSVIYCAPEVADDKKRNSSSDIWSLGCVFLEMLTLLKGFAVEDLRDLFRKHSGGPRYYKNLDVAMDWIEKLNGYGIASDNEAGHWIRKMVVMDPSSRTTAQSLSELIVMSGRKGKSRDDANAFCGECCCHDHHIESSSEAPSDDDVWTRDFDADVTTLATSPPVTDNSHRPDNAVAGRGAGPNVPSGAAVSGSSGSNVATGLGGLKQSEHLAEEGSTANLDDGNSKSRETVDLWCPEPPGSNGIQPSSPDRRNDRELLGEGDATQLSRGAQVAATAMKENDHKGVEADLKATDTTPENALTTRQTLLEDVTRNFPPWPFTDFRSRLPVLTASSWQTPAGFLDSVRSDVSFMEFLRSTDISQFDRFRAAETDNLLPLIHLLLLNGLDVNNHEFRDTATEDQGAMPLMKTLHKDWDSLPTRQSIVKLLIGFGARMDDAIFDGRTPLSRASATGNIEVVKIILGLSSHLADQDLGKTTSLVFAARHGHLAVVDLLVKSGASNEKPSVGGDPVWVAAKQGHQEIVSYLLETGGYDEHINSRFSGTPATSYLQIAAKAGHVDMVRLLLDKGADLRVQSAGDGFAPIHYAAREGHHMVVKLLLDEGADIHLRTNNGWNLLHLAASNGHYLVVNLFLNKHADLHLKDHEQRTPLHHAAENGHYLVAKLLLDRGADIESRSDRQFTPLHLAARGGHSEVVKLFLDRDAGLQLKTRWGSTSLYLAAYNGYIEIVRLLLDKGADAGLRTCQEYTPLHQAAENGHHLVVEALIMHGASFRTKNSDGSTPGLDAARNGHLRVLEVLIENGMGVDEGKSKFLKDGNARPIHEAARKGHAEVVKYLLSKGADPMRPANRLLGTMSPHTLAVVHGHQEVVRILEQAVKTKKRNG